MSRTGLLDKVSLKILMFMLAGIASIMAVFSYMSYLDIRSTYFTFFNDKTLLTNRIAAAQVSAEDLLPYIEALRRDEGFKERQMEFYEARRKLIELEKQSTEPSEEKNFLWRRVRQFYKENDRFKDPNYLRLQERLEDVRVAAGARYFYIFTDTGLPGMYTYILDAHSFGEEETRLDLDDIGAVDVKESFMGADAVFHAKSQVKRATHNPDNSFFGELYYAYAPLLDKDGGVVAAVGTDIDLSGMRDQIVSMMFTHAKAAVVGSCLFILVFYFLLRRVILTPIVALRDTAACIADGRIYTSVPEWLLRKNDEMGLLGQALAAMTRMFQDMITDTRKLLDAAVSGRLGVRNDPSRFKGDVSLVVRQINDTLDIFGFCLDSMTEALFILDGNMEPVFRNKGSAGFFDVLGAEGIVRKILADEFSGKAILAAKWKAALQSGVYTASAWLTVSGAETCFAFTCCELVLSGIKRGVLVIAADITDLMLEKSRAQSASKAKSEFLSRVSHELRSPMNVIIGMAKLGLKESKGGGEEMASARERFENIVSASGHLLSVINDVLDMSRIEAGKIEIKYAQFNLSKTVSDCYNLLREQAEEKGIEFSCQVTPGASAEVVGDGHRLTQVLLNLLTNALKFTERGGRVTLTATPLEPPIDGNMDVMFRVEDTGIGMSEEFLRKIFVPFEQEDQYIQRKYQGTGLGLSICHRLVSLMGGEIEVKSKLGSGSAFSFTLPFIPAQGCSEESRSCDAEDFDFTGVRLLLVDDIELNRTILRESLEDTHLQTTEAKNGAEAVRIFKESEEGYFDIVFMDIQMPFMDGYQATTAIRALSRKDAAVVPIVAMTANALQEDVEQAFAHGMNGHLAKPVDIDACLQAIAGVVSAKKQG
ncbi:MAG: response regulator [Synergistaceae bacterium]|jgi:signal transduction histidine kinase/CheY-like chemotaxis protein|nr:response regulator [Synergistaceae bacterium]